MGLALRSRLGSRAARSSLVAVACVIASAACGDGIGTPIRKAELVEIDAAVDAAEPEPMGPGFEAGVAGFGGGFPHGFPQQGPHGGGDLSPDQFCSLILAEWQEPWVSKEQRMFDLIAQARARSEFFCQGQVYRGLGTIQLVPELRCSARMHTADMVVNDFFGEVNPNGGPNPPTRMAAAGFEFTNDDWGVLIEDGRDPDRVFQKILETNRNACEDLASNVFNVIGIGYAERQSPDGAYGLWTLDFARR